MGQRISDQERAEARIFTARREDERKSTQIETQSRAARFRSLLAPGSLGDGAPQPGKTGTGTKEPADPKADPTITKDESASPQAGPDLASPQTGSADPSSAGSSKHGPAAADEDRLALPPDVDGLGNKADRRESGRPAEPDPAAVAPPPLTPWARPEGPSRVQPPRREMPGPLPGERAMHQLLMGRGALGAEARLSIAAGPLAGAEIHLHDGPGGLQAAVLTQTASSRQTLVSAMDQVAKRLREKGHQMDVKWGAGARSPQTEAAPRPPRS